MVRMFIGGRYEEQPAGLLPSKPERFGRGEDGICLEYALVARWCPHHRPILDRFALRLFTIR